MTEFCKTTLKHAHKGLKLEQFFSENKCDPALTVANYLVLTRKNESNFLDDLKTFTKRLYNQMEDLED